MLAYVTGGLAYGKVDVDGTSTVNAEIQSVTPFSVTSAFSHNAVKSVGWWALVPRASCSFPVGLGK